MSKWTSRSSTGTQIPLRVFEDASETNFSKSKSDENRLKRRARSICRFNGDWLTLKRECQSEGMQAISCLNLMHFSCNERTPSSLDCFNSNNTKTLTIRIAEAKEKSIEFPEQKFCLKLKHFLIRALSHLPKLSITNCSFNSCSIEAKTLTGRLKVAASRGWGKIWAILVMKYLSTASRRKLDLFRSGVLSSFTSQLPVKIVKWAVES